MEAKGIPRGATASTQEFFPNDLRALKRHLVLNRLSGGTAAVIVEPLGPESGTRPVPIDFNQKVRELCDEFGALLIFDEVVTGFRVGLGGAQGYFGVKPDLTILLDLPLQEALDKIGNKKDRIEQRSFEYHTKVRNGYLDLAKKEPSRIQLIKVEKDIKDTQEKIRLAVNKILGK